VSGARASVLLACLFLLGVVVTARLFQVQVLEHQIWADEAARLVHQGREIRYRRGRILDAEGTVLARDEEGRQVVLVYRTFRREHPLGQVAHARSLLVGRPLSLQETREHLLEWAAELLSLRPAELSAFARGEDRDTPWPRLEPALRSGRAADLSFYLHALLGLEPLQWKRLGELAEEQPELSYLELAARQRYGTAEGALERTRGELEARLRHSMERLELLARWARPSEPGASSPEDPLEGLIGELEEARRSVEDAAAARLFAQATGFSPGRLEPATLLDCFDARWITDLLAWDEPRLAEWAALVRRGWRDRWRDGDCLPRLMWELVDQEEPADVDAFLDRLAVPFQSEEAGRRALAPGRLPVPWRELGPLAVFDRLGELFEADSTEEAERLGGEALPLSLAERRADPDSTRLLPPGEGPESFRARLRTALEGRRRADVDTLLELGGDLCAEWDRRYQETVRRALDDIRRQASPDELGPGGGLILAEENRDRAAERAEFFLKDYGLRSRPVSPGTGELSYDVVYLLTRYEADFPGFQVQDLHTRVLVELPGDDEHPADRIVGRVSAPTLADLVRQRREAARLRALKSDPDREEEEQEELERLIGEVRLPDQVKGVSGIEGFFEPELAGRNGYSETRGLADVFGRGGEELPVRDPEDGQDVWLTLHAGLQAAAQRSLRHPLLDEDDPRSDLDWQRSPVGAVVLLSVDGDVLAAASEPDDQSSIAPDAEGQRLLDLERTLRKPTFQPPGSVFKSFVASWALDHGLDPEHRVLCGPIERGGYGYKDLRCWNPSGHGEVNLEQALVGSCNAYFAWLGETLRTGQFQELAAEFGFGQPTGVRRAPPWDPGARRIGLLEDRAGLAPARGRGYADPLRRMAANGLGVVEATPMQLGRAMLALATGERRDLRLVSRVGERELESPPGVPLDIRRSSLERVRRAMIGVARSPQGTAHKGLGPEVLGLDVAVKTGSADLENRKDREDRPVYFKHAWVGGWLPASDPKLIFVVFEHHTSATSSHGAVHLARQVLQQGEVLAWLADQGVDVSRVPAR